MGPAVLLHAVCLRDLYRNCSINSQSVTHAQLVDLQSLAGLLPVLAWAGDSPGDQGFLPGRRVQKREKSIQEEYFPQQKEIL